MVQLRVAEQYVAEFGKLAKTNNTVILPATLSDVGSMVAVATNVLRAGRDGEPPRNTLIPPGRGAQPTAPQAPRPLGRPPGT